MEFEMDKVYSPQSIEDKLYKMWEESGAFVAHRVPGKKPFTIVMPPPNITGQLHMGHAMDCLLQDAPIRYHRMKGDPTLWLPGTDHASIATEVKVVEQMAKEGLTKDMVGREGFLERAWAWKKEYGGRINRQQRRLGASCDWSRERFTMDEGCNEAVREVFVRLYEKGLIYRGSRIINWCPECQTALSDAEVEYEEQASHLWHIRYPGADGGEGVVVATTRPETMLGDTGVAVNPNDERYTALVGKNVILPLLNKPIPVVADEYVDMEFGTGAVKMSPAHDPNDFEVGKRHNLEIIRVTNDDGTMNENAGKYQGMTAMECREAVVNDLRQQGYLVKIEDYTHNVGTCYRCHHTVDPVTSTQWFVKMEPLAKPAIEAVRSGKTRFVPDRFSKTYFNWMENIRDWCISRQLWWGHRIPAWYCDDCGETIVAKEAPHKCPKCGSEHLHQDEDVLDTWFSSGMWPFSTLGWPEHTKELEYFYPTSTLVTGYDIIFFWVARMIVFGMEVMHQKPFSHVYIHGLVRDELGRKMSKSLGNGVDPLEIIKQYGADSLRFSLVTGNGAGGDMRFGTKKVEAARNFCNKLYNATRFVLMNIGDAEVGEIDIAKLDIADKWLLNRLNTIIREITANMDGFDLNLAAQKIYDFVWTEFCDWYIELAKPRMNGDDEEQKANVRAILCRALTDSLKLLHPFMPFITEELYLNLPNSEETIMRSAWPTAQAEWDFPEEAETMEEVMDLIRATRNIRAEMSVAPSRKLSMTLVTHGAKAEALEASIPYIMKLAGAEHVAIQQDKTGIPENAVSAVAQAAEAFIPLSDLIDVDKERERLNKEAAKVRADIERSSGKLNNAGFVAKAPEKVIAEERKKLAAAEDMLGKLEARLEQLNKM